MKWHNCLLTEKKEIMYSAHASEFVRTAYAHATWATFSETVLPYQHWNRHKLWPNYSINHWKSLKQAL
jgi:hypothetical protein